MLVVAILALAGLLWYPSHQFLHIDEHCFIWCPLGLWGDSLDPKFYNYGHAFFYLLSALYKITYWFSGETINHFIAYRFFIDGTDLVEVARSCSWLFGLGTMLVVWRIGVRVGGKQVGLYAMGAMLLMPLCTRLIPYAMTDVPAMFFAAVALWAAVRVCQVERAADGNLLVLGSIAAGLAASTKYPAALSILPLWVAYGVNNQWLWRASRGVFMLLFPLSVAIALTAFFFTSPYVFIHWQQTLAALGRMASEHTGGTHAYPFSFWKNLVLGVGVVYAAAFVSLGELFGERRRELLVLWSSVIAILLFVLWSSSTFLRYWLPLVPAVAVLSGVGLNWVIQRGRVRPRVPVWVLPALVALVPAWMAVQSAWLIRGEDTRAQARAVIEAGPAHRFLLVPGRVVDAGELSPTFIFTRQVKFFEQFGLDKLEDAFRLLSQEEALPPLSIEWKAATLNGMLVSGAGHPESTPVLIVNGYGTVAKENPWGSRLTEGEERLLKEEWLTLTTKITPIANTNAQAIYDSGDWMFLPLNPVDFWNGLAGPAYTIYEKPVPYYALVPTAQQFFGLLAKNLETHKLSRQEKVDWPAIEKAYREIIGAYSPDEIFSVGTTASVCWGLAEALEKQGKHEEAERCRSMVGPW